MNENVPANARPLYIGGMPFHVNLYAIFENDSAIVYTQCDTWVDKEPRYIGQYSLEYFNDCHRAMMMEATSKLCRLYGLRKVTRYE
jgi:hypothetical protein